MPPLDAAAALAVVLIWAGNFVVGKVGLARFPPLLMMGMRFSLAALLLAPFLRRIRGSWPALAALGVVFGGLHFALLFSGLQRVDAGLAAIAIQLGVPFSVLLAAVLLGDRPGPGQVAGMSIAFGGVALLAGAPRGHSSLPHFLMVVGAALAWAVANVLIKRLAGVPPMTLNAWIALLAAPQLLGASLLLETGQREAVATSDAAGWAALLYTVLAASIVAYGLWYRLLARYPINRIVPLTLLAPVLAVLLGVVLLGETLTPRLLLGGALVIGGVAMIQLLRPASRQ